MWTPSHLPPSETIPKYGPFPVDETIKTSSLRYEIHWVVFFDVALSYIDGSRAGCFMVGFKRYKIGYFGWVFVVDVTRGGHASGGGLIKSRY